MRERLAFEAIAGRPQLNWGQRSEKLALWVVVNCESYDLTSLSGPTMAMTSKATPDIANIGWREYGSRVGVWRIFELCESLNIPVTVALNSQSVTDYPAIVGEIVRLGWEVIGHGRINNESLQSAGSRMRERDLIFSALAGLQDALGSPVRGWLGPALSETEDTLDLLSEAGVEYVADWVADDQPFWLYATPNPIVGLPYTLELNDFPAVLRQNLSGAQFADRIVDQYRQLSRDSQMSGRVMCIALHPFISGVPHRALHLRDALATVAGADDVWVGSGSEVLDSSMNWLNTQRKAGRTFREANG